MGALLSIRDDPSAVLFLTLSRINGALLAKDNRLVADLGLTAARWQVLGVVANTPPPLPIASIVRNIGLARQGVRQVVGEMVKRGFVRLGPNPHHQRKSLVVFTTEGRAIYGAAKGRWDVWTRELVAGMAESDLHAAASLMQTMLGRLDPAADHGARA